jgi:hypothetical protein
MEILFSPVAIVGGKYSGVIVSLVEGEEVFKKSNTLFFKEEIVDFLDKQYLLGFINNKQFDFYLKKMLSLNIATRKHMYYFRWFFKTILPFEITCQPICKCNFVVLNKKHGCIALDSLQATPLFFTKTEGKMYVDFLLKDDLISHDRCFEIKKEIELSSLDEVYLPYLN